MGGKKQKEITEYHIKGQPGEENVVRGKPMEYQNMASVHTMDGQCLSVQVSWHCTHVYTHITGIPA
jgi:hypothetical protein